jgi:hypothetical protein
MHVCESVPNKHFARARVALGRERRVADAGVTRAKLPFQIALGGVEFPRAVRIVNYVVKIRDALFADEIAEDVHVAVRERVGGENVVVGDDDDFVFVPDFGGLAELAFEHADGARPANVVRHEHVGVHPDVVAGLHARFAGGAGEQFFRQCHNRWKIADAAANFNSVRVTACLPHRVRPANFRPA